MPDSDALAWYSPCGYVRGPFNAAAPVPICPRCYSSAWSTWPAGLAAAPPAPLDAPELGDIQRRCWTLYVHPDGNGQCGLFNGHAGEHDFSIAAATEPAAELVTFDPNADHDDPYEANMP
jgi:hypothetical protein